MINMPLLWSLAISVLLSQYTLVYMRATGLSDEPIYTKKRHLIFDLIPFSFVVKYTYKLIEYYRGLK